MPGQRGSYPPDPAHTPPDLQTGHELQNVDSNEAPAASLKGGEKTGAGVGEKHETPVLRDRQLFTELARLRVWLPFMTFTNVDKLGSSTNPINTGEVMNSNEQKEEYVIDEKLTETIGIALALIVGSIGREIGEQRLHDSLRASLFAGKSRASVPPKAIEIASYALVYLEAQLKNLDSDDTDQPKH